MCKWLVFKHADAIQNAPEAMAASFVVTNHLKHASYISTKTNKPCDKNTWYLEQGMTPPANGFMDRLTAGQKPAPIDPDGGDEEFADERKYADMAAGKGAS